MARGLALKSLQLMLRAVQFCCAAVVLAIFSYFLATMHNHGINIDNYIRSIEGISGVAVLYTLIGLALLCFLAGITFFSFLGMLMDFLFIGGFIYIAYETRGGARSCNGYVNTVYGSGDANSDNYVPSPDGQSGSTVLPSFKQACQMETATFAVSIVAIVFFILSLGVEFALWRNRKREARFGPSPANNYTSGSPRRRFWQRKHAKRDTALVAGAGGLAAHEKHSHNRHSNPDTLPSHTHPSDVRNSYQTDNTAVGNEPVGFNKYSHEGTRNSYVAPHSGVAAPAAPVLADHHRHAEYRTPGYTGDQSTGVTGDGVIPARDYNNHSVHNTY